MKKRLKKITAIILTIVMISLMLPLGTIPSSAGTVIENAISWAVAIANDDSHLYSQSVRWGPSYDCSSFVISAFRSAGVDTGNAVNTSTMKSNFTQHGFIWIPWSQIGGVGNLIRGDVLLTPGSHTEIYLGNNQNVGAHSAKRPAADQISVSGYYYHPWEGVLRYNESSNPNPDPNPNPVSNHNPITGSDAIEGGNGFVHVRGWAFDPDNTSHNIFVHVYIGGQAGDPNAECYAITAEHGGRSDVDNLYHCGDHHAYDANVSTSKRGVQTVYLYAINVNEGENVMFASGTVNIGEGASGNADPVAHIDYVSASEGKVHVAGWIYDPDDLGQSLMVHVYIGGISGSANAEAHAICANAYRPDVNNAYHCGDYHGFETYVPTTKTGEQEVHIYAINIGGGINPCFFDGGVNIPKETEPPTILESYISNRTNDGFRINIVAGDNVGVEKISIATWTQDNQSDLIWTDAVNCGGGYFILDRKYSDFQTNPNGIYNNHAYVYDYSGNVSVTCPCLENEPPTIDFYYITNITQTSYRICAVPHDNVGVHDVWIAAWTASSNESDIKWLTVYNDGNGTYYADVNRDEFQQYSNSEYFNQINVFDNSGNEKAVRFKMDYKLASDTGKCVPEGDYRIVTALSENRALDVGLGSKEDGANISIYSNLTDSKQIFSLVYDGNGFYKIINKNSGKALDVTNDTYVNGTNVQQWGSTPGAPNQQWILQDDGDGFYKIISRTNGLALDVAGKVNEDGTNVWVYTNYPSIQQKWKLRRVLKGDIISVKNVIIPDTDATANPKVSVTVDGNELTANSDYTIKVSANKSTGKGTVTITGINSYCDSVVKEFYIMVDKRHVPGNVNYDNSVDVRDITAFQRHLAETKILNDTQKELADLNKDGIINIQDATLLQMYLAEYDVTIG